MIGRRAGPPELVRRGTRRLRSWRDRGSISLALAVVLGFAAIFAAFAADLSRAAAARARAQAAADAAALAAAQELIVPGGEGPSSVAAEYAERNGARLTSCECDPGGADAIVTVGIDVRLPLLAEVRTVEATARAVILIPPGSDGLQPAFAASLGCLFDRVEGLSIVSGFRTRAQQAALYRLKPHLAAPPGHSMHELGLAADLGYTSQRVQEEAHREAPRCGLHFPVSYEPWHVEPMER